jgi:hypothetical protein
MAADTGVENKATPWLNFNASFLIIVIVCGVLSVVLRPEQLHVNLC